MKISELILALESGLKLYGDVNVVIEEPTKVGRWAITNGRDFWSNETGWTYPAGDMFSDSQKSWFNLPIGGHWIRLDVAKEPGSLTAIAYHARGVSADVNGDLYIGLEEE